MVYMSLCVCTSVHSICENPSYKSIQRSSRDAAEGLRYPSSRSVQGGVDTGGEPQGIARAAAGPPWTQSPTDARDTGLVTGRCPFHLHSPSS